MTSAMTAQVVEWCDEAETMLVEAVDHCHLADLKHEVNTGVAVLFKVEDNAQLVGYYLLRVEEFQAHSEAVLVAGVGKHPDINLTDIIIPMIEQQFLGCKYLRIHTARSGLIKKLSNMGFEPQEFVMRKLLT